VLLKKGVYGFAGGTWCEKAKRSDDMKGETGIPEGEGAGE
jgi:hypothetical protein